MDQPVAAHGSISQSPDWVPVQSVLMLGCGTAVGRDYRGWTAIIVCYRRASLERNRMDGARLPH